MKLYWRIKKNGKWTWKAVPSGYELVTSPEIRARLSKEEEE